MLPVEIVKRHAEERPLPAIGEFRQVFEFFTPYMHVRHHREQFGVSIDGPTGDYFMPRGFRWNAKRKIDRGILTSNVLGTLFAEFYSEFTLVNFFLAGRCVMQLPKQLMSGW